MKEMSADAFKAQVLERRVKSLKEELALERRLREEYEFALYQGYEERVNMLRVQWWLAKTLRLVSNLDGEYTVEDFINVA